MNGDTVRWLADTHTAQTCTSRTCRLHPATCLTRSHVCTETPARNRTSCQPCLDLARFARAFLYNLPAIRAERVAADQRRLFANIALRGTKGDF